MKVFAAGGGDASAADERRATRRRAAGTPASIEHGKAVPGRWRFDSGAEPDVPCRPAAAGRARPFKTQRACLLLVFPAPSFSPSSSTTQRIWARKRGCGREGRTRRPFLPHSRFAWSGMAVQTAPREIGEACVGVEFRSAGDLLAGASPGTAVISNLFTGPIRSFSAR
jgi:hypothetical protein